ncbi:MAG: hypothetical protein ABEJ85_01195 [Haloarculaceae archaeon]
MRRRDLLRTILPLVAAALAGCRGSAGPERGGDDRATVTPAPVPTTGDQSHFDTPTPRRTVGRPVANVGDGRPAAQAPDRAPVAAFESAACPPVETADGRLLCYPDQNPDRATLSLGPTTATVNSGGHLRFVLVNREGAPFTFNPNEWRLHGFDPDRGAWRPLDRGSGALPLVSVGPGESYTWLAVLGGTPAVDRYDERLSLALDSGRYAFGVTGLYGARRADTGEGRPVTCVTPFTVA